MAKRPATKAKRLPAKKKKKRKLLVAEIHKEKEDISAKALEALWKLRNFDDIFANTSRESLSWGLDRFPSIKTSQKGKQYREAHSQLQASRSKEGQQTYYNS